LHTSSQAPREGPIPAPSSTPPVIIPSPPPGDNSPPPALTSTPPTKKEGVSFQSFVVSILSIIFTGYAIYYGWTMGQQYAREYLMYTQSLGLWTRSWFTST
jgi:hypothetical protein